MDHAATHPKTYFENLDALRFFAFILVFISHASLFLGLTYPNFHIFRIRYLGHGDLGVSFFFVLSGFLITYLLLEEKRRHPISLKHFYLRKVLRLLPLYFIVLIVGFFVIPHISSPGFPFGTTIDLAKLPWYIFFLGNIDMTVHNATSAVIAVLWAISVEEQFYLIWPSIIKFFNRKNIVIILLCIFLASSIYRFLHSSDYNAVHYFTLSVVSDLVIGSLTAMLAFSKNKLFEKITHIPKVYIVAVYMLLFILMPARIFYLTLPYPFLVSLLTMLEPIIFCLIFAFIILEQSYSPHSFWKAGKTKIATHLGRISYGLYAYHIIIFFVVLRVGSLLGVPYTSTSIPLFLGKTVVIFLLTIMIARLSFRYIESPFLRLKNKYGHKEKSIELSV